MSETLHGFAIRGDKLVVAVTSHGCTDPGDFRVEAVSGIAGFMLTIERTKPDNCRMTPHVRELEFPLPAELKDKPFTVQNRFAAGPHWLGVGLELSPEEPAEA